MKLSEYLLAEVEREMNATRRILEQVPMGKNDWKPAAKSMPLGYLAAMVAGMTGWVDLMVNRDELDIAAAENAGFKPQLAASTEALMGSLDAALEKARTALRNTDDEHLMKPWKFVVAGHTVSELPRHVAISDSVLKHLAHHRGQLSVYLRLLDAKVPAIYGPSADEPIAF